ncbi:dapper homolog 1 isoform X2 [Engraulis encrasicolus]|uniref:dapper homolog 1 isoform X2 n=1 Tax=Engraulis encrasicolus TaxID=184585 RepID=UPI002FD3EC6E
MFYTDTMKQTVALAEMLASKDGTLQRDRKEFDLRSRERMEGELDRVRTRERLDATIAGIGELEYLRQRQELLVRSVLNYTDSATATNEDKVCHMPEENYLNSEEKLLEENILLLRKQLNCLRRRDAGLINQLQELDRQISDLRLDTKPAHDHAETDSRPSSDEGGFTDCEDQNAGTVRRSLSAPYSPSVDDGQGGRYHCDLIAKNGNDVYRYPSPLHAVAVQSPMYFQSLANQLKDDASLPKPCDASSSSSLGEAGQKSEQPLVPQSTSWPATSAPPSKKLDSYIFGLLQRRAQPMRPNKPRTSINTDPSKSILRQASLCVRQAATGQSPAWPAAEVKPNWQATLQSGGSVVSADGNVGSPQRQWSTTEAKSEVCETAVPSVMSQASVPQPQPQNGYVLTQDINSNSLLKKKTSMSGKGHPLTPTLSRDSEDNGSPNAVLTPKHQSKHLAYSPAMEDRKSPAQAVKSVTPKKSSKSASTAPTVSATVSVCLKDDRSTLERVSLGSSSQSQDEGNHMVSAQYIPAQKQALKLRKGGGKSVKIVKVKSTSTATSKSRSHAEQTADVGAAIVSAVVSTGQHRERHRSGSKKPRHPEDLHYVHPHRSSKKASSSSSRAKRIPASIPEGRVLDKHVVSTHRSVSSRHHGHHHGHHHGNHHGHREPVAVVAKPKHKRSDYRRLRAIAEVPYDEAFRRAHRRQKRELLSQMGNHMYVPSTNGAYASPYAYVGSDSEYSAECASLFHSTILDTSEDERSNYTTNCFGDSESSNSEAEYVDESTTTSDSEESGSGGGGGGGGASNWPQFSHGTSGAVHPQEMTAAQAKAFVKIKASHNLKKRILRFRSGSLKLMTTV